MVSCAASCDMLWNSSPYFFASHMILIVCAMRVFSMYWAHSVPAPSSSGDIFILLYGAMACSGWAPSIGPGLMSSLASDSSELVSPSSGARATTFLNPIPNCLDWISSIAPASNLFAHGLYSCCRFFGFGRFSW